MPGDRGLALVVLGLMGLSAGRIVSARLEKHPARIEISRSDVRIPAKTEVKITKPSPPTIEKDAVAEIAVAALE